MTPAEGATTGEAGPEQRAFVGLGGNLGDRLETLRAAVRALEQDVPHTRVVGASSIYETRPVGPSTEPFLNAVVELRTRLSPRALLVELLAIEARHGRQRLRKWDARTLDLDLLVMQRPGRGGWEPRAAEGEGLALPHPGMAARDFVLVPLGELTGGEPVVGGRAAAAWLEGLAEADRTVLRRLDEGLRGGREEQKAVPGGREAW